MAIDFRSVCHCVPELYDHPTLRTTLIVLCAQYEHDQVWGPDGTSGGIRPRLQGIGYSLGTDFATPPLQDMDVIRRIFFCCTKRRDDETQTDEDEQYGKEVNVKPSRGMAFGLELTGIRRSEKEPPPLQRSQIKLPSPQEADAINQDMLKAMAMYRALSLVTNSQDQLHDAGKPSYRETDGAGASGAKASGSGASDAKKSGSEASYSRASAAGVSECQTDMGDEQGQPASPNSRKSQPKPPT